MKKLVLIIILCSSLFSLFGCSKSTNVEIEGEDFLQLQKESDHFIVYSFNRDIECLDDLVNKLETNYERISVNLGYKSEEKIRVDIYPDIISFHEAIGRPNSPEWFVGTATDDKIQMVSPLNPGSQHNYESLMKVVVHEFTHVITGLINSTMAYNRVWLSEGIALFEAQQMDEPSRRFIIEKINENKVPSFSQLNSSKFVDVGGYQFSYTIIEYIVENYGYETIKNIIKAPEQIYEILGITESELEQDWLEYIRKSYTY